MKKPSPSCYVKIVKNDKSEIIAEITISTWLKDFIVKNKFLTNKKLDKKNPKWLISKKDAYCFKGKIPLIDFVNMSVERIVKLIADSTEALDKMKIALLASMSEVSYSKTTKEIENLEYTIACLRENKLCLDNFLAIVYYELTSRDFFKDNKKITRDIDYTYRPDASYDLYFFWK